MGVYDSSIRVEVEQYRKMTDAELEKPARDYAWLAERTPQTFAKTRDRIFAELELRGRSDIIERVRVYAATTPEAKVG